MLVGTHVKQQNCIEGPTHTHGDGERERDAQNEMLKHERVGSIKR